MRGDALASSACGTVVRSNVSNSRSTTLVAREEPSRRAGAFQLCSAAALKLALCWRARLAARRSSRRLKRRTARPTARLDGRNAAPRTPARAAARHTYGKAATTLCSTHDAIDATARMQQHNKPRAPTTTRTNARIFVRARASESPRRRRTAREEPAHALVRKRPRHLHFGIMLRVRTALQGFLSSYGFWGHHKTS